MPSRFKAIQTAESYISNQNADYLLNGYLHIFPITVTHRNCTHYPALIHVHIHLLTFCKSIKVNKETTGYGIGQYNTTSK